MKKILFVLTIIFFLALLLLILFISGSYSPVSISDSSNIPIVEFEERGIITFTNSLNKQFKIDVEIADDSEEQIRGLMYREELSDSEGMLFMFPDEVIRNFWMKNTLIPLDIIFLDKDLRVVHIASDTTPNQTTETYNSILPSKYVLEMNAGWSQIALLSEKDQIFFEKI